jgi:NAD(P)-dependent dehydrogenase (short-subunit alcohol dehydrogenase family)
VIVTPPPAGVKVRPAALITGANRGIGRAIAVALAARGFDVVINDIEQTADTDITAAEVQKQGGRAKFIAADIAITARHPPFVEAAFAAFGRLDCLVNNAGVQVKQRGDILEVEEDSFDRLINVNLRGTFFLTKTVARRMLWDVPGEPPRTIITISSVNASVVSPNRAEYCISKSGLTMMNKLFALRLAEAGVACFEVRPGVIRTEMTKPVAEQYDEMIAHGIAPIKRWGEPEDVGRVGAMLASGALPFSTGDTVHVDGGLHMRVL